MFVVYGGNGIDRTVRTDLNKVLNNHPEPGIDITESPNVRFIAKLKIMNILNQPVIFGRHPFFYFRKYPSIKTIPLNLFFAKGGQAPPPHVP